ncbi:asparagine synthase (glutamine-hydrolyzing) [bacterium]|nr:asparagine synthase (glutamine-hydrolyzing) [bacterium]
MCGIFGIIGDIDKGELTRLSEIMIQSILHRGPDNQDVDVIEGVALGHTRLSIRDLHDRSNQPFYSKDRRYCIVYNGEIYNAKALKSSLSMVLDTTSDTELVLKAFEKWGKECLQYFNGMFSFAVYDFVENELFAVRDRFGIKPFYYSFYDDKFVFSSEFNAFKHIPWIPKKIDKQALYSYLAFNYISSPKTINKHICKLDPGHYLTVKNGKLSIKKYWTLMSSVEDLVEGNETNTSIRENSESKESFEELLVDSVQRRCVSDVPLGTYLSGGVDSSLVTAVAKNKCEHLKTFTIQFQEQGFDELQDALRVSKALGCENVSSLITQKRVLSSFESVIESMNEPFADSSFFSTYFLSELASREVKVVLTGDGADELAGGYPTYKLHKWSKYFSFSPILNLVKPFLSPSTSHNSSYLMMAQYFKGNNEPQFLKNNFWMGGFSRSDINRLVPGMDSDEFSLGFIESKVDDLKRECASLDRMNQILYMDFHMYLQNDILFKVDHANMCHGVEARVPFLDHRLVTNLFSMASNKKLDFFESKKIIKKAMPAEVPKSVYGKEKRGFSLPIGHWIHSDFKELVYEMVNHCPHFVDRSYLATLVEEHYLYKADHQRSIWNLLILFNWLRLNNYTI